MKGYCSNSPLRCSIASNCEIVESKDNSCPKCLKALIVVDAKSEDIEKVKITIKQTIWLVTVIIVFIVFYLLLCPQK